VAFQKINELKMALAIGFVGMLVACKPEPCQAQAEIDPDHYEIPSADTPTAKMPKTAPSAVSGDSYRGRIVLPCEVRYAGVTLERGSYSISIRSLGNQNLVTFIPDGSAVKIQIRARVRPGSSQGPSILVLEHVGRQFRLTEIRLFELRMTLGLEAGQRNDAAIDRKVIPISYTTGEGSED
jgi:hypothetical protein